MKLETARQFDPGWKPTLEAEIDPPTESDWSEFAAAIVLIVFVLCLLAWRVMP